MAPPPDPAVIAIPLIAYPAVLSLVGYLQRYVFPLHGLLLLMAACEA